PQPVEMRLERRELAVVVFGQKRPHNGRRLRILARVRDQLHAVARGHNHALENPLAMGEVGYGGGEARFLDVHPLAHLDGRRAMIDYHEQELDVVDAVEGVRVFEDWRGEVAQEAAVTASRRD